MTEAKLILLPGLGADARLFSPQLAAFPELVVPPWLPPLPDETLSAYGERMARVIAPLAGNDPCVVGGVSFGGMVALEIARHLKLKAVLLIASNRTGTRYQIVARVVARSGAVHFAADDANHKTLDRAAHIESSWAHECRTTRALPFHAQ